MIRKIVAFVIVLIVASFGTANADESFLITVPDGAPAMAVSELYINNPENVRTIAADTIAAEFASEESDFIIAPVNAGAKLFSAGKSHYRLAAIITWGNLVFASQKDNFNLDMINNSKLILFGENTINASVALYVLQQKGIVPAEIEYLAGAKNTQELMMSDPESIVLTAEPIATIAKMKNNAVSIINLNTIFKEITGFEGFTQAGLFVREKDISEKKESVSHWLELIRESVEICSNDPNKAASNAVAMGILPNENIAKAAIPNCGIRFMYAKDAKEMIEMTVRIDPKQFGGDLPSDEFYFDVHE